MNDKWQNKTIPGYCPLESEFHRHFVQFSFNKTESQRNLVEYSRGGIFFDSTGCRFVRRSGTAGDGCPFLAGLSLFHCLSLTNNRWVSMLVARNFNKVIIMDCWRECCFVKISDSIHPEEPSLRHCSSPRQISALMLYLLRMNKSLYVKNVNFRPLHLDVNDRKKEKSKAFGPHFTRRLETCCWLPSRPFGMRAWPSLVSSETWWYFLPFLWIASCIWSVTLSWPAWRSVIFYAQS